MRPVSAEFPINQPFGSMATAGVAPSWTENTVGWYVRLYGNYQPFGHAGCDIKCPEGTPVYAMASGTVLWADWGTKLPGDDSWGPNGYFRRWALYKGFPGIVTVIQHDGWIGVYAHLSDAPLSLGDKVAEGQRIATSGSTGGVAPHLHVEALVDLSYPTGNGLIYGRTNPEPFFGSKSMAAMGGTITPLPEEDDVSAQEVLSWPIERTDGQKSTVAVELAKIGPDNQALQAAILDLDKTLQALPGKVAEATMTHPVRLVSGQDSNLLTELAALRPDVWQALRAIGSIQLTGDVTADAQAIAKAVNDEAAKRMAS